MGGKKFANNAESNAVMEEEDDCAENERNEYRMKEFYRGNWRSKTPNEFYNTST